MSFAKSETDTKAVERKVILNKWVPYEDYYQLGSQGGCNYDIIGTISGKQTVLICNAPVIPSEIYCQRHYNAEQRLQNSIKQ